MSECEHSFQSDGVAFKVGHQLPGTSARSVVYYDVYFCQRCLKRRGVRLEGEFDNYQKTKFDARPIGRDVEVDW